jgi:dienelactone hydrolase
MHVSGTRTAAEYARWLRSMTTAALSSRVTQDVLLLAGTRDHIVPFAQLTQQLAALTAARSVTARVFSEREHAQNHCQVGNIGLALKVIIGFLALALETASAERATDR